MIRQITVRVQNRPGRLYRIVKALSAADVDLKALEVNERGGGEYGEIHMIANNLQKASEVLTQLDQPHEVGEVLVVEMEDRVGGLAGVLEVLDKNSINIHFMYAFVTRIEGKSLCVFSVDEPGKVRDTMTAAGLVVIEDTTLEGDSKDAGSNQSALDYYLGGKYFW